MQINRRKFALSLLGCTAISRLGIAAVPKLRKPNVITIVLDDVGYSDLGCYGGEVATPHINSLAEAGLRYVHFDTKAVCSATRASLITGRNNHSVNFPDVPDISPYLPTGSFGADAFKLPHNAESIAQLLKHSGYTTWAIGKWHLIPMNELGRHAPRDSWPRQRGFDYFYGFARGWTDQFRPDLVENNDFIKPTLPADYHLSVDLVDKAIGLINNSSNRKEAAPFFLYLAFGAAHAPIQVPREYSAKYDSVYAVGWDSIREQRFARMKKMGIIPPTTLLPPRNPSDRAWTELNNDEKVVFARFMAVYAGFLEHADAQIGRLLSTLKQHGLENDTLVVLISDNGAASEAGQTGNFDGLYKPNVLTPAQERARLDELGTGKTQAEYPRPWAMAGVTPLRRYKLWPYSSGTRTPLIVRWPAEITDRGGLRRQFVDVVDIAPTVADVAGTMFSANVDGVAQLPVAGRSFRQTFTSAKAPTRQVQYFELRGNRAITAGGWRAVSIHDCGVPYDRDRWELFNLSVDFSESTNLAELYPDRVKKMKSLWQSEWARYNRAPLAQPASIICTLGKMSEKPFRRIDDGGE